MLIHDMPSRVTGTVITFPTVAETWEDFLEQGVLAAAGELQSASLGEIDGLPVFEGVPAGGGLIPNDPNFIPYF